MGRTPPSGQNVALSAALGSRYRELGGARRASAVHTPGRSPSRAAASSIEPTSSRCS